MARTTYFKDRMQAGEQLARHLLEYQQQPDAIVLALPRGGVPVGLAVSRALDVPLDVMPVRKLGVPGREECAMGAVAAGGLCVLRPEVVEAFGITPEVIEAAAQLELHEIERREKLYRGGKQPLHLQGWTVILVDDGLATGATMLTAVKAARRDNARKIVVAVPVGPAQSCEELRHVADELICLHIPEHFYAVGLWYENFEQISDAEVAQLLAQAWQQRTPPTRGGGTRQTREPRRTGA
ncbi:MAG TPA: phosphoribosyltransferase [Burkholderiaceae bacterium]|nr:phosphoribosyltransferase [Burkholderiaceae bacterium]